MKPWKPTGSQIAVLRKVWRREGWYRSESNGERVTLASLHARGLLVRRARRGVAGEPDAAYEYDLADAVRVALTTKKAS